MLGHGIMYVYSPVRLAGVHVLKGHVHIANVYTRGDKSAQLSSSPDTRSVRTVTPLYHPNGKGSDLWSYKFRSDPRCTAHEGLQLTGLL